MVPGGYASDLGVYANILVVIHKFLEVMVLFQLVIQPLVGVKKGKNSKAIFSSNVQGKVKVFQDIFL